LIHYVLDSEFDDLETPPRYRPESVQYFCRTTGFTESEIKKIYRHFKTECPTGLIKEDAFRGIYSQFFPQGGNVKEKKNIFLTIHIICHLLFFFFFFGFCIVANVSQYAHYVFQSLDHERNGILNFEVSNNSILTNTYLFITKNLISNYQIRLSVFWIKKVFFRRVNWTTIRSCKYLNVCH
jgi:hypothetical protein